MLRLRNWGLKYVGVQDRTLKLCPGEFIQVVKHYYYWGVIVAGYLASVKFWEVSLIFVGVIFV